MGKYNMGKYNKKFKFCPNIILKLGKNGAKHIILPITVYITQRKHKKYYNI